MDKNTQNKSINVQLVLGCTSVTDRDRLIELEVDAEKYQNFAPKGVVFGETSYTIVNYKDLDKIFHDIDIVLDASITNKDQKEAVKALIHSCIIRKINNIHDEIRVLRRRFDNPSETNSETKFIEKEYLYNPSPIEKGY